MYSVFTFDLRTELSGGMEIAHDMFGKSLLPQDSHAVNTYIRYWTISQTAGIRPRSEFRSSHQISQTHGTVTEMLGHGTHNQPAGTITDDTEMALCIARSLSEHHAFRPDDIAKRFVAWYDGGPFDIGLMTSDALQKIKHGVSWRDAGQQVWESRAEGSNAGIGSIMRCAPYSAAFRDEWSDLARVSATSSAITRIRAARMVASCSISFWQN